MVVDIPLPSYNSDPNFYENQMLFNSMKERIERIVLKHKDHPALLYWNLGNEIKYPQFYKNINFFSNYNLLISTIKHIDPNHPISTSLNHPNKLKILSINWKSPELDFISFNSFGTLSSFSNKLKPISPIWSEAYVISEWGVNGPWEAKETSWKAPIEETSTKKAEQIKERYNKFVKPLRSENSFGDFVFYWGNKNELTPTWYSLFDENSFKTQAVHEMENIWSESTSEFYGPKLQYLLLNEKGAAENIILPPNATAKGEIYLAPDSEQELNLKWEIRQESWHNGNVSKSVPILYSSQAGNTFTFKTPTNEGPYRLFLFAYNGTEYFATANIPFYILNPENGE